MDRTKKDAVAGPAVVDATQATTASGVFMPDEMPPDADVSRQGALIKRPTLQVLRKRADFLRTASARRQGMPGFLLQARRRAVDEAESQALAEIRIGFTCSKKIGNAVTRNRAKRRLRALAREILPVSARAGWDYVLVGRPGETVSRDFVDLRADLIAALARLHGADRA